MDGQEEVLEVYGLDAVGYRRVMAFGQWRVAVLAHADMFAEEKCVKQERHLETDEAFVLLDGSATLVVGEKGERIPLEKGRLYNVRKGGWHAVITWPGARLLVVENASTAPSNSEYRTIETKGRGK